MIYDYTEWQINDMWRIRELYDDAHWEWDRTYANVHFNINLITPRSLEPGER